MCSTRHNIIWIRKGQSVFFMLLSWTILAFLSLSTFMKSNVPQKELTNALKNHSTICEGKKEAVKAQMWFLKTIYIAPWRLGMYVFSFDQKWVNSFKKFQKHDKLQIICYVIISYLFLVLQWRALKHQFYATKFNHNMQYDPNKMPFFIHINNKKQFDCH